MRTLAFLVMVAATAMACGDDGPSNPKTDAGDGSGSADAETGDPTPVKLTITLEGAGVSGIKVHFQRADSSLYATVMTDASGVASSPMPSGGFVTAVNPYSEPGDNFSKLYTYSSVQPGDELLLKESYGDAGDQLLITAPIDSSASVTDYLFTSPCDSSIEPEAGNTTNTTYSMFLDSRCGATTDILIASLDASEEIVKYTYAANQSTTGGTLDLSGATLTTPVTKSYTYTNIPTTGMGVGIETQLSSAKGRLLEREAGGDGTSVTAQIKQAAFPGAFEAIGAFTGAPYGMHGMFDWGTFSSDPFTTDVGARLLKEATSAVTFDIAYKTATWSVATTGVTADFVATDVYRSDSTGDNYVEWSMVGPYTGGSVQFPTLPPDTTDYNFKATDVIDDVEVNMGKVPGGWDGIREKFFGLDGPEDLVDTAAAGSITFQFASNNGEGLRRRPTSTKRKQPAAAWKIRRRM